MSLTFEMANLDFAPIYRKHFHHFDDEKSALLMDQIIHDEIRHVSFGYRWLNQFKQTQDSWDYWTENLAPTLTPKRATGFVLHEENRRKAGIPEDWIEKFRSLK